MPKTKSSSIKTKERLYQNRLELLVDKARYEKELEDFADQIRFRIRMQENLGIDPLLNTFDILDLQEISLRLKKINLKQKVKH